MTHSKLIEVAKAICRAEGYDPDKRVMSAPTWVAMSGMGNLTNDSHDIGAEWEQWLPHARAAIQALMTPTEDMLETVDEDLGALDFGKYDINQVWQAMLHTILNDGE